MDIYFTYQKKAGYDWKSVSYVFISKIPGILGLTHRYWSLISAVSGTVCGIDLLFTYITEKWMYVFKGLKIYDFISEFGSWHRYDDT